MLMALCQTDMLSESIVTSPEATEFCVKNIVATNASSTTNSRICPTILKGWGRSQFLTEPLMQPMRSKEDLLFIFFLSFWFDNSWLCTRIQCKCKTNFTKRQAIFTKFLCVKKLGDYFSPLKYFVPQDIFTIKSVSLYQRISRLWRIVHLVPSEKLGRKQIL